jgi:hypothetical protein
MRHSKLMGLLVIVLAFCAMTSTSASAFKLEWEVCEAQAGGKFENHLCGVMGGGGGWEWKKPAGSVAVKYMGEAFKLTSAGKEISCTTVEGEGTLTGGSPGTDKATKLEFTGCKTSVVGCAVHSPAQPAGTIIAKELPSKLTERETSKGAKVLADVVEQEPLAKEIVTLSFEPAATCTPGGFVTTKVKGTVAQECLNDTTTGQIVSRFPTPELKKNTLEAFGSAATLVGEVIIERSGAGAGWGIRCV